MNYCNCPNCATDDCPAAKKADNGTTHWNGTTHYAGCIQSGVAHYECALQEIGRLRGTITHLRAELEKKTWVGLTDEEVKQCSYDAAGFMIEREVAMRAVEAKLKEKNCG